MWIVENIKHSKTWQERLKPNLMFFGKLSLSLLFCLLTFFVITPACFAFESAHPKSIWNIFCILLLFILYCVSARLILPAIFPACLHIISMPYLLFQMIFMDRIFFRQQSSISPQCEKKLMQYQKLLDAGIITKAEYNAKIGQFCKR